MELLEEILVGAPIEGNKSDGLGKGGGYGKLIRLVNRDDQVLFAPFCISWPLLVPSVQYRRQHVSRTCYVQTFVGQWQPHDHALLLG